MLLVERLNLDYVPTLWEHLAVGVQIQDQNEEETHLLVIILLIIITVNHLGERLGVILLEQEYLLLMTKQMIQTLMGHGTILNEGLEMLLKLKTLKLENGNGKLLQKGVSKQVEMEEEVQEVQALP